MPQPAYNEAGNHFVEKQLCPSCGRELLTPDKFGIRVTPKGIHYREQFIALSFYNLKIVGLLFQHYPGIVTKERIYAVVWADDPDPPIPKTLDVHLWKIRKLLKPIGLGIQTWHGRGWSLLVPDAMIAIAKAMHEVSDIEKLKILQDREVVQ